MNYGGNQRIQLIIGCTMHQDDQLLDWLNVFTLNLVWTLGCNTNQPSLDVTPLELNARLISHSVHFWCTYTRSTTWAIFFGSRCVLIFRSYEKTKAFVLCHTLDPSQLSIRQVVRSLVFFLMEIPIY